jgi:hypothetical protein
VSLTWEAVTWLESGIEILLRSSKVDQTGVGFVKFIPVAYGDRCPVKALTRQKLQFGLKDCRFVPYVNAEFSPKSLSVTFFQVPAPGMPCSELEPLA